MKLEKGKRNIVQLLHKAAEKYPDFNYASRKTDVGWESYSYKSIKENTLGIARALLDRGLKKGDHAAILSEGSPMWIMAELSLLSMGMISVPLSVKLLPEELPYRLDHSESKAIFVSKNHLAKVLEIAGKLENQHMYIVYLDNNADYFREELKKSNVDDVRGLVLWELLEDGRKIYAEDPAALDDIIASIDEDDVVNISYTSGTTGNPKGIMLTHLNYYSNANDGISMFKLREGFRTLVILPVDHSFAHTVALYGALFKALDLYFLDARGGVANALKNIPINLQEIKPEFLLTVPALSGNFMNKMKEGVAEKGKAIEGLFKAVLNAAIERNRDGYQKASLVTKLRTFIPYKVASTLIFRKLANVFGGKIEYMVGGGALLDIKQQQFYYAIGTPIFQGYGLTEAAPIISANTPFDHKMGTSGKLMPSVICRIMIDGEKEAAPGETGEIVIKGDNVMKGYYKNPEETSKTIRDGWLWTGDLGYFDEDGFLVVTGRNKALLISEDGEKYSPESIEEAIINTSEFIHQAMIYNDHKKYTTAVVTIDPLKTPILKGKDHKEVVELIKKDLHTFKKDPVYAKQFPQKWTPSFFYIAPEVFSEDNKMVNSTMKMVRHKVVEHHKGAIEKLYEPNASKKADELNIQSVKTMLN